MTLILGTLMTKQTSIRTHLLSYKYEDYKHAHEPNNYDTHKKWEAC